MSLPGNVSTVTVTSGPHTDWSGAPIAGSGIGWPAGPVVHDSGQVLHQNAVIASIDANGLITWPPIAAEDSPHLLSTGISWTFEILDAHGVQIEPQKTVLLPAAVPNVNLELLPQVLTTTGTTVSYPNDIGTLDARYDAANAATARLRRKMTQGIASASLLVLGDSTGVPQSVNDPRWVYLLAGKLATAYPAYTVTYQEWIDGSNAYGASPNGVATTVQTGTGTGNAGGPFVLTIYNASVSGKRPSYHLAPNVVAMVSTPDPDLTIISHGKNEGVPNTTGLNLIQSIGLRLMILTETVRKLVPKTAMLIVAQNPSTADTSIQQITREYDHVSSYVGAGFVNVCQAFLNVPTYASTLTNGDGIHPNTAGSLVWVNEVWKAFGGPTTSTSILAPPSSLVVPGQVLFSDLFTGFVAASPPPGWTSSGNVTFSQDTVNFEGTKAFSVRMISNTAALSRIFKVLVAGTASAKICGNEWVTFMARMRRGTSQPNSVCQVSINDGTGAFAQSNGNPMNSTGFYWEGVSFFVNPGATNVTASIFCDGSANNASDMDVDRCVLVRGRMPRDIQ